MQIWEISAKELLKSGGPILIPIFICSIIAVAIILGKMIYFSNIKTDTHKLKKDIFNLLKNNKLKEAIRLCESNPSPVAKILKAGIAKFGDSRDEMKERIEDVSLFEIPKLEKRFTALATIAHITPLLGLLGTVTGMTGSFYTIEQRAATMHPVTPGDLAGNIGEALITTVAGLLVAIPTFVAYNYLVSRVNAFVLEMERAATELINFSIHLSETNMATETLKKS
ncbi:MAG: MotA/TolQ/ExbB proton channel family protein [Candidatus Omnitrophica bacterium]|nr:MotA/TolQ/ExbB proton channel family protein [Candidatus Omnitrophota bacterium]